MRRHKRVALVSSIVGAMVALVLPLALTSPASAAANNTVTVTKVVNGAPTEAGNIEVVVTCGTNVQTLTFAPTGGTQSASIPSNLSTCTVQETEDRGADATAIQAVSATAAIQIPNAQNATAPAGGALIEFDNNGGQLATVGITNTYIPAQFNTVNVTKQVVGDAPANAFYRIDVTCWDGVNVPTQLVFSALFTSAGGTQALKVPADGQHDVCIAAETVREPTQPVAVAPFVDTSINGVSLPPAPGDPGQVGQTAPVPGGPFTGANQTRSVTVTNRYESPNPQNTFTVTKRVRGHVTQGTKFYVTLLCFQVPGDPFVPGDGPTTPVTPPNTVPVPPNVGIHQETHEFGQTGGTYQFKISREIRDCYAFESDIQGDPLTPPDVIDLDWQANVAPGDATLFFADDTGVYLRFATGGNHNAAATLTNRYSSPFGDNVINVTKVTTGTVPAGEHFLVEVNCSGSNFASQDFQQFLLFGAGQPQTQQVVQPAGPSNGQNSCVAVETVSGGAVDVDYAASATEGNVLFTVLQPPPGLGGVYVNWPNVPDPVGPEGVASAAQVTITNKFPDTPLGADNTLTIKKRFRGNVPGAPSVDVRVRCSGGGITEERLLTITDQTPIDLSIPANRNNCVVRELSSGGATSVEYRATSATGDATDGPNSGRIEFGTTGGESGRVRITNHYPGTCPPGGPKFC